MTKQAQILHAMDILRPHFPRGVMCCQIAAECNLTRQQIEKDICTLVSKGRVKIIDPKGGINNMGHAANVYALNIHPEPKQNELF